MTLTPVHHAVDLALLCLIIEPLHRCLGLTIEELRQVLEHPGALYCGLYHNIEPSHDDQASL